VSDAIDTRAHEILSEALKPPTREEVQRSLRIIAEASARTERAARRARVRRLVLGTLADVAGEIEMKLRERLALENDDERIER
jgi:hypothetical protein